MNRFARKWSLFSYCGDAVPIMFSIRYSRYTVPLPIYIAELRSAVGDDGVITAPNQLQTYECDGLTNFRSLPAAVVLPRTTQQVQDVVRVCARHKIPFVGRGAGTGLSGGALPAAGGIVISLARMNRVLKVDIPNHLVIVEPGVINAHITQRVAAQGYFYAPDPSSQSVCTIGGNIAENAGGAHCLKYGFTVTHTLALEVVLPNGDLVSLGSLAPDALGYDLAGVFVGSEGTLGIATKIGLRIVKRAEECQTLLAAFASPRLAGQTVSDIIAAGMLPAALEIMDTLAIEAAEAAVHAHYPMCGGLLLVELDGPASEVEALMREVRALCQKNGASEIRVAQTEAERALVWKGRKAAFAAMGRISPNYIVQDGVIPRTALPEVLDEIERMANAVGLRVANVFHAGDGNLHPLVLYDRSIPGQEETALDLSYRILHLCVDRGGSITGEHGVGKEKQQALGYMFSEPDLDTMQRVRCAFDCDGLANPDKVFPRPRLCAEKPGPYVPHPLETAGIAELF
jgi:glycolate oxidase